MKLSVIVPVFNMAADDKLKWCMDSLVGQTISDYEIIAVDDCSTDDSLSILQTGSGLLMRTTGCAQIFMKSF